MQTYDQLMEQAEERLRAEETVQAMQLFAEAHKAAPNRKEPLVELGVLFMAHEDTEGAIGFFEKALALDGVDVFTRLNLALAYYEVDRIEPAVEHLKEAVLLIQYIVASTRIDEMFGKAREADLQRAEELETTGEQAIDLMKEIAGIRGPESETADVGSRTFRLAS